MTDEQINKAVAEELGYQDFDMLLGEELIPGVRQWEGRKLHGAKPDKDWVMLRYTTSLDACREFEMRMDVAGGGKTSYETELVKVLKSQSKSQGIFQSHQLYYAATASPIARCQAFLRLRGKWREE